MREHTRKNTNYRICGVFFRFKKEQIHLEKTEHHNNIQIMFTFRTKNKDHF